VSVKAILAFETLANAREYQSNQGEIFSHVFSCVSHAKSTFPYKTSTRVQLRVRNELEYLRIRFSVSPLFFFSFLERCSRTRCVYVCIYTFCDSLCARLWITMHLATLRDARDRHPGVCNRIWHQQGIIIIRLNDCSGGLWWRRSPLRFGRVAQASSHMLRATRHGIAFRQSPRRRLGRRRRDAPRKSPIIRHMHYSLFVSLKNDQ